MIQALLPVLSPILGDVVKRVLPEDKDKRAEIERELNMAVLNNANTIEQAASSIVLAEAKSESWLASSWRPILMIIITMIIGWNFLVAPLIELGVQLFTGNMIPLAIELPDQLWSLLMIGVGGYVGGRSLEKVAKNIQVNKNGK
tara:strand:- start:324 stop:755 length:432 start_codon:yes stop_codon:yes gene_type:complete